MKPYRPLFLRRIDVRLPGLRLRRLRLNRHLGETVLRPHHHPHGQILLYLGGRGQQELWPGRQRRLHEVCAGTAFFIPPGVQHAFCGTQSRRPLCLVIDVEWGGGRARQPRTAQLNGVDLRSIRQRLSELGHLQGDGLRGETTLRPAGIVLLLLDTLGRSLGLVDAAARSRLPAPDAPIVRAAQRALASAGDGEPLRAIARRTGYQRDYLNRVLKSATGLTLGQMRSQRLAMRAQRLLREARRVAEVSEHLGFCDANYFTRWFRHQTGLSPRAWRERDAQCGSLKPAV